MSADRVVALTTELAERMRQHDVAVGPHEALTALAALNVVELTDEAEVRQALIATLCRDPEASALLEALFADWTRTPAAGTRPHVVEEAAAGTDATRAGTGRLGWSPDPALLHRDFGDMSAEELAAVARVVEKLGRRSPVRPSRRMRPVHARRGVVDVPRTLRASLTTAGEPLDLRRRRTAKRPRRLVFVCDVSGSMDPYARMLLHFVYGAVGAAREVEAFTFGTELTRVTRHLAKDDAAVAVEAAFTAAADAGGGTRTGESLAELTRRCNRFLGRGADVLIMSDGWDRGDPQLLSAELARVRRCAARVIWLNPLKGHAGFQPLTVGMQAALPHIDDLLAVGSVAAIAALTERLTA